MADGARLNVLFASPAYWPALAFGGPIWMARELNEGLVRRGHHVDALTTSLVALERPPTARLRTVTRTVAGVRVHYLATPVRYRWMGVTPSAPLVCSRLPRPHVGHVFGYRDPVGTAVAAWCARKGVPYVLEPLGMFRPKWRKVALKLTLDRTLFAQAARNAAAILATSSFERDEILSCGIDPARVVVRGNGFPEPLPPGVASGQLRAELGVPDGAPLVLYVGRIAAGKGIPLLLEAAREVGDAHVVLVGPDGNDGTMATARRAQSEPALRGRVHVLPPYERERPLELYAEADVFVLPSAGESFGMVAAEAAAAGTAVVVTDRCGVAEVVRDRAALVVPYEAQAIARAVRALIEDTSLRRRLGDGGRELARERSWDRMVDVQEALYRRIAR